MIEREMKFLISKDEFEHMLKLAKELYPEADVKVIEQINYYYDTVDLQLFSNRITLRIRESNGKYVIQKKSDKSYEAGVRTAKETEKPISFLPTTLSSKDMELPKGEFVQLGCLKTKRTRFVLKDGTKLDFDISNYFDIVDYEIEIELSENPPKEFLEALSDKNGVFKGKYQRFLEIYSQQQRF